MNVNPAGLLAAHAVNEALHRGSARALPARTILLDLSDDADPVVAIAATRATFTKHHLRARPVVLWQGTSELVIGPHGVLTPRDLIPDNRSVDTRVQAGTATRVVISWLDGPTRETVAARLAEQADTGLVIDLLREEFDALLADVLDATLTAYPDPAQLATHPVLDRVRSVNDGRDTYYHLLDVAAELLPTIKRQRGGSAYLQLLYAIRQLHDQRAVDAVLDNLDNRILGGQFFPVRDIDDDAMLTALFGILALTACSATSRTRVRLKSRHHAHRADA